MATVTVKNIPDELYERWIVADSDFIPYPFPWLSFFILPLMSLQL
jgi:hypothetical protein